MYSEGRGVTKDVKEAARLYRLSAEQGQKSAQKRLADLYEDGVGVLKNEVYAYMWSSISAANGNDDASSLRDRLEKKMTKEEISKARSAAKTCMETDYDDCELK